jgi:hypothetical protein
MKTNISFLNELDEDLSEAAWRESLGRSPGRRPRRVRRRPRRRALLVLASVVAFLTLAGAIGWFVMRGQEGAPQELRAGPVALGSRTRALATPAPSAINDVNQAALTAEGAAHAGTPASDREQLFVPGGVLGMSAGTQAVTWSAEGDVSLSLPATAAPGDMTRIVKTGQISVVVGSGTFQDKFRQAALIAANYRGGYVQSSSTSGSRSGTLTIRVPAARFEAAMNALAVLGARIESQSVTGKNVTSQFVDLGARLSVWQEQLRVLNGLLAKAASPEATIRYTNLIMDVQFRIEEIKGQLRVLRNEADMSTIKASLREEGAPVPTPKPETITKPNLGNAFQHAVAGFLAVVFAVVVGLGYLVPVSVLLALVGLVFLRVRRRRAVV